EVVPEVAVPVVTERLVGEIDHDALPDLLDGHGAHADPPRGAVRADRQEDAQPGIAVRVARRLRDEELDRLPDRVPGRERPSFAGVRRGAPPDGEPAGLR